MNKTIACPECNGHGFITECGENWIGARGCQNCNGTGTVEVPMTNADHVRAMSDEELANVLTDYSNNGGWITETGRMVCYERIIEWLKQPAKEDA